MVKFKAEPYIKNAFSELKVDIFVRKLNFITFLSFSQSQSRLKNSI